MNKQITFSVRYSAAISYKSQTKTCTWDVCSAILTQCAGITFKCAPEVTINGTVHRFESKFALEKYCREKCNAIEAAYVPSPAPAPVVEETPIATITPPVVKVKRAKRVKKAVIA